MEVSFKAGWLAMRTVGAPGAQGEAVAGTHGAGVGVYTPRAAAVAEEVAAATAGFDWVVHIAKETMFFIGLWSMILAEGVVVNTLHIPALP